MYIHMCVIDVLQLVRVSVFAHDSGPEVLLYEIRRRGEQVIRLICHANPSAPH